jgi:hypothetical protein
VTCSLPPSNLIARSTFSFHGWRAKKFSHPPTRRHARHHQPPPARGALVAEGVRTEYVSMQQRKIHLQRYTIKVGGGFARVVRVHHVHVLKAKSISRTFTMTGNMPFYFFLFSIYFQSNLEFILSSHRTSFLRDTCVWSFMP